jgi:hypothetical protein
MALVAQVHIARLELASAHQQLQFADRIWNLDQEITRVAANRESADADSKLSKVSADTAAIVSMLRRYQALADFNAAAGALQSTLGMQIDIGSVNDLSLPDLTRAISSWQHAWQEGQLSKPRQTTDAASSPATSSTRT